MCRMQPVKASYQALGTLLLFIAGVLCLGALLAPVLFSWAQGYIAHSPGTATGRLLASKEFPSYFSRACMLVAFAGLYPLLKTLRISWSSIVGDVPLRPGLTQTGKGMALAMIGIALMGFICLKAGACRMRPEPAWSALAMPLLSGISVATLEELLFRGAILGILTHSLGARAGLVWTTGVFAILHFLKPPVDGSIAAADVTWASGFWVIGQLFRGFGAWNNFIGEFILLTAVGWALGQARLKTNALWLSIGLHAGWVAGMKYFGGIVKTTTAVREGDLAPWMITNTCRAIVSPIVGIVPTLAVLATALLALWLVRSPQKAIASTSN